MTSQKIFDKVARHLLKQGRKSSRPATVGDLLRHDLKHLSLQVGDAICLYRAPNGDSCAVGCLVPDSVYHSCMEGYAVEELLDMLPAQWRLTLARHKELLERLQRVHDEAGADFMETVRAGLWRVAMDIGLSTAVLEAA